MNDEIKEILAYFEEYVKITDMHDSEPMLNWKDLKIVLDYITNLQQKYNDNVNKYEELLEKYSNIQQENERLTQGVTLLTNKLIDMTEAEENYKSRIDKAIQYIEEKGRLKYNPDELINILRGDSNE